MSIIYNALKKTQEQRLAKREKKIRPYSIPLIIAICVIIGALGASIYYFSHYPSHHIRHFIVKTPNKTSAPIQLNGVYISEFQKMAMINQTLYSLGAQINNRKLIQIEDTHILLEDSNGHRESLALNAIA